MYGCFRFIAITDSVPNRPLKREHKSEMDLPTHARHGIRILFFVHISFVLFSISIFVLSYLPLYSTCTYNTDSTKGLSIMIQESRHASHMRTSPKINRSRAMSHTDAFKVCLNVYTCMCNLAKRANETTRYDERYWRRRKKEMEYTNARKCELCMRLTSWVKLLSTRMFSLKASDGNVSGEKWLNICMYGSYIENKVYVDFYTKNIFRDI